MHTGGTSADGAARSRGSLDGIAEGLFEVPDNFDALNDEIAEMFYGETVEPSETK